MRFAAPHLPKTTILAKDPSVSGTAEAAEVAQRRTGVRAAENVGERLAQVGKV
jgi:hypothetical protein